MMPARDAVLPELDATPVSAIDVVPLQWNNSKI